VKKLLRKLADWYIKVRWGRIMTPGGSLKVCICGGTPRLYHNEFRDKSRVWFYRCDNCGTRGLLAPNPQEAVLAWNAREEYIKQLDDMDRFA
jgi:hypothetical protein